MQKFDPYLTKQSLKIFWQHAMRYKRRALALVLTVLGATILGTYFPILYGRMIDQISDSANAGNFEAVVGTVFLIVSVNIGMNIFWRVNLFINNFFQGRVMADLTNTCYEYLQKHSYSFFTGKFVGSLVTKVKRYERAFEQLADQLIYNLGRTFLEIIIVLGVVAWRSKTLALIILAWAIIYISLAYVLSKFKLPYDIKRADADTQTTAQLADSITNNVNIKMFASYPSEYKLFSKITNTQFLLRKKSWDLGNWIEVAQGALMVVLEFVILYLAVLYWSRGQLTPGDIVLFQVYIIRIFDHLWEAGRQIRAIYESLADANEMTEMLLLPHEIQDAPNSKRLEIIKGKIEFKNIGFTYKQGNQIFSGFNLVINPGEKVALIGPSGGGKSTIVKLLLRFFDIQKGVIDIDGQDIAKVTQDSLRQNMAMVPQEPILFHRSLMENIRYGNPKASDNEVIKAAKLSHAHEFITSFPQGYNTYVGERGIKLSGGERQRVAIARAILKNEHILVLDEATSSLDSESEMFIQDALKNLMRGKTVIVIAHRLSTIMQMDRIVVIENGKITEEGKHEELLKAKQGTYQRLWQIQAGGFA